MALPLLAVLGLAASVVGTISSISAQRKSARAQEQQQTLAAARSRRQGIREAQIKRSQAVASAQGAGAIGSSGAIGGIGSLGSQLGADMGFGTSMSSLSGIISKQNQRAQMWGGVADIGSLAFKAGGGQAGLSSFFKEG